MGLIVSRQAEPHLLQLADFQGFLHCTWLLQRCLRFPQNYLRFLGLDLENFFIAYSPRLRPLFAPHIPKLFDRNVPAACCKRRDFLGWWKNKI